MEKTPGKGTPLVPRNKYLLGVAMVTFILGLLQATDVVDLPFGQWFSWISGSIFSSAALGDFMEKYGYASLFGLMTLESASLPVPSEVVLPYAGFLVAAGVLSFWPAVLVSTAAGLFGALVDYYLAVWLGRAIVIRLLSLFKLHGDALRRAEGWFARSGQWTVFVARFVPGLRTVISLPAGLFRMRVLSFAVMTLAGCFAWSVILIYAGTLAGKSWGNAFSSSTAVVEGLSALVAAVSAAYLLYYAYPWILRRAGPSPASES